MAKKIQQKKKETKGKEVIEKKKELKKEKKDTLKQKKVQKQKKEETEFDNENLLEDTQETYEELAKKQEEAAKVVKEVIVPKINQSQIKKAIKILSEQIKSKYSKNVDVLSNEQDELLYVNFFFDTIPIRYSIRPNPIKITNSLYSEKFNTPVCIFVKDPKSAFKELEMTFPFELKVIDISKLKLKYERFEQRRNLIKQYEIFLCDSKVYFLLKKLLGKPFYSAKKFPVPVKIDYEDKEKTQQEIIEHVKTCTFFTMSKGPIYNVKFGRQVMTEQEKIQNLNDTIEGTLPHILKYNIGQEELKMITIRGNNTVELPVYHHLKEDEIKMYLDNE